MSGTRGFESGDLHLLHTSESKMGHPVWWRSTHLSDDETVAKMGHPVLWLPPHAGIDGMGQPVLLDKTGGWGHYIWRDNRPRERLRCPHCRRDLHSRKTSKGRP